MKCVTDKVADGECARKCCFDAYLYKKNYEMAEKCDVYGTPFRDCLSALKNNIQSSVCRIITTLKACLPQVTYN